MAVAGQLGSRASGVREQCWKAGDQEFRQASPANSTRAGWFESTIRHVSALAMSETLKITVEGRMARVTLNRSEGRKAFNDGLIAELRAACEQLGPREDLRAKTARRIADIRVSSEGKAGVQSFLKQTPAPWL
jgi:hypothetical protein